MLAFADTASPARSQSAGFAPPTVRPPQRRLVGLAALAAGARNPLELWDEEFFRVPGREIRQMGKRVLELADPDLFREVLVRQAGSFVRSERQLRFTRPLVGSGILAATGANWKQQRKAAAPAFRSTEMELLVPAVHQAARRTVACLDASRSVVDAAPVMMQATLDVIAALLGAPAALDNAAIDQAAHDYLGGVGLQAVARLSGLGWLHDMLPLRGKGAITEFRRQAAGLIAASRNNPDEHLVHRLRGAAKDQRALEDSVIAFIAAGAETAAVGLTWALYLIAHDPMVQERLAREAQDVGARAQDVRRLHLHKAVIQEALRLFPPIALVQRTAIKPATIGDWRLDAGDEVVCSIYVMHRSERVWAHPTVFDPDRFLSPAPEFARFAFLPFGAGHHACVGLPLAYLEMTALLAALTRRFVFSPVHLWADPVMRLTLRPRRGLPLLVERRSETT